MAITVMDLDPFYLCGVFPAKKRGFRWHYEIYRDGVRMTRDYADTFDEVRDLVQNFMMHYRSNGKALVLRLLPRSTMTMSPQERRPSQEGYKKDDQGRDLPSTAEYRERLRSLFEKILFLSPVSPDPQGEDRHEILALLPPWPMARKEWRPPQDPIQCRKRSLWKWRSLVEKLRNYGPLLRDLSSWSVELGVELEESISYQAQRAVRGELNLLESLGELHQCPLHPFDHLDFFPPPSRPLLFYLFYDQFIQSVLLRAREQAEIILHREEIKITVLVLRNKGLNNEVAKTRNSATTTEDRDHRRSLLVGILERLSENLHISAESPPWPIEGKERPPPQEGRPFQEDFDEVDQGRDSPTTDEYRERLRSLFGKIQWLCPVFLHPPSVSPTVGLLLVVIVFSPFRMASAAPVSLHVEVRGLAIQGRPYTLTCVVTPAPPDTTPAYTWYRDGHVLHNQTGRVLAFTSVSKSDEGHYQCGLNQERQLSDSLSLRVIVFEKLSMVSEVEVEEGQTVILNCSVHSDPTAFLNWRVDGKLVLTVRSNSYGLVLHNASRLHLSVVECQAYNEALPLGFMSTYTLIRIKGTYEIIPRPWLGPRGTPVVHRPFGMECLVMDIPNRGVNVHLTYTWYKDDRVIEGQSDMILDIPSVTREDSGLYTCTARNGRAETTSLESNALEVVVLVPPVVHMEPQTPDQTVLGAAGHNLTLTCKVTEAFPGVAPDGYRWSYLPSPQAELRPLEGRESTLTLRPLTKEDRGQYFCQAWNYEDFDGLLPPGNASVTVDVLYLGHISLTPDLEVNEGEHVTLTCEVDCNPAVRLAWIVGGVEVRHVTGKVDHYIIPRAACSDSNNYTCVASNSDLPGLEIHASTHVLVNCSSPGEEGVTAELPAHTTEQTAAEGNSTSLKIALPIVFGALVVIVATVFVVCLKKRRGKSPKNDANGIASEKKPMNGQAQLA